MRQQTPFCISCWSTAERVTTAEPGRPLHSHHIVKIKDAPHLRLDAANVLVVCETCHAELDSLYESNRIAYTQRVDELKRARELM